MRFWLETTTFCFTVLACALAFGHSNNTTQPIFFLEDEHGNNPESWMDAVGLLFPDVALVLGSGDSDFEFSLDCNPSSVAQNHFAMFWAHLPLHLQQHEAGCWVAFDYTVDVCMARSAFCGSGGDEIWAGLSSNSWESECIAFAEYERDICEANFN